MTDNMAPCPWCGGEGRETRFDDTATWMGQRYQHICTNMIHFCTHPEDDNFVNMTVQIRGRDKADCIARWNSRMETAI